MNPPRILLATAVAALVGGVGIADAADTPVISAQHSVTGTSPVSIPGTGVKRGAKLPAGSRVIYRSVRLAKGQEPHVTLTAPSGKALRGLADSGKVGFVLVGPKDYPGKAKVVVKAFSAPKVTGDATGKIYALVS
jgi:hypothetical protein